MKKTIIYFGIFIIIFTFVFRSLIFNLTTNLLDSLDYPYIVWVMFQSISKISTLDFTNFFNTNAFSPFGNTLFFSDLLLPQAILALPIFTPNQTFFLKAREAIIPNLEKFSFYQKNVINDRTGNPLFEVYRCK